ncbi:hypothetical protein GLOIN_2v1789859 [Rhizophagus irregularis DAOM 181602=DAOM 197198]|uniref:Crinkler effector protein N-terminal domain-containing protein n=1 Tax=Rhizophagus irregularis (strain DAOM 181602 / DAOM 197198 / MUCL 43194) TaxID=747089 RepID=A0A2P4P0C9_RHIID|nr:hypothetical protein GLOIN_2v1789859 [Rhizophagus irregularis DAOM 181602=DAOM 197198]POG58828.1 hypothetical protein GLOIN_2v1789859 [Rhizophagus irregularis DAOM 181602=DAOM 197198]|eukprot:XP_025165694.1 hypothetical protein GLOIN_2v1789859 [Rhizophagus irregularis DAOM 181602=DAOM 197198]
MSITLFCLVKGNTTANAFSIRISRDEPVSELKKAVKAEKAPEFDLFSCGQAAMEAEECIHVIVEPPASTATSNREQELLDVAGITQQVCPCLKDFIRELYKPPALENDGAVLNFMCDGYRYLPRIDVSFREMLQSLVSKNNLKFTVFIETPSKPFSDWSVPKVCELYGLSDDPNPSNEIKIIPEKLIAGHNGQGNLDYARSTNRIVGLVEVKKDDFKQGFTQTTVQMESSLTCHIRKVDEIEDSYGLDKVWGIVTDAEK